MADTTQADIDRMSPTEVANFVEHMRKTGKTK